MKVIEFYKDYSMVGNTVKVVSSFNGKILCKDFNPKKHTDLGERELKGVFTEINAKGNYAKSILCLYADGTVECEEFQKIRKEKVRRKIGEKVCYEFY